MNTNIFESTLGKNFPKMAQYIYLAISPVQFSTPLTLSPRFRGGRVNGCKFLGNLLGALNLTAAGFLAYSSSRPHSTARTNREVGLV